MGSRCVPRYPQDTNLPTIPSPPLVVVQRDDGLYQIGVDDESSLGPFESQEFRRGRHAAFASVAAANDCQPRTRAVLNEIWSVGLHPQTQT
jgi:hypothetical protein